jgi:DNA-binding NarL/FixJ family response regulator
MTDASTVVSAASASAKGLGQGPVIVVADDHPLFRGALKQAVAQRIAGSRFIEVGSFEQLLEQQKALADADLVILDLSIPGVQGLSGLMYLRSNLPALPVMMVSATDDRGIIRRSLEFGAAGFMPKTLEPVEIGEAVQAVLDGAVWTPADLDAGPNSDAETQDMIRRLMTLTPQQVRVLMMVSEGLLNKQIAYELNVSEATVKAHVSAILQKLGVDSRTQAVIMASKIAATGWTPQDQTSAA